MNFVHVPVRSDNELKLIRVAVQPFADDWALSAQFLVLAAPSVGEAGVRGGVAELGAERGEIARDAGGRDRCCGFDCDVFPASPESGGKLLDAFRDHWLPAGEDTMVAGWEGVYLAEDGV